MKSKRPNRLRNKLRDLVVTGMAVSVCIGLATRATSSTFVGNGGNSSNLDLAITLSMIQKALTVVSNVTDKSDLCSPLERQERYDFWAILDGLDLDRQDYCAKFLYAKSKALSSLARINGPITFKWTGREMEVKNKKGAKRKVQAVANTKRKTITINENQFRQLSDSSKIALITHELLHFIKINGKLRSDSVSIGPYKTAGAFFDVIGSALAATAQEHRILNSHHQLQKLSRGYRKYWLEFDAMKTELTEEEQTSTLSSGVLEGTSTRFRYQDGKFGYYFSSVKLIEEERSPANPYSLNTTLTSNIYTGGLSYKYYPISTNPLSYGAQIHLLLKSGAEYGTHEIKISDGHTTIEDSAKGYGLTASFDVMLPLFYGFWLHGGYGLHQHTYEFETFGAKLGSEPATYTTTGVSYAFDF